MIKKLSFLLSLLVILALFAGCREEGLAADPGRREMNPIESLEEKAEAVEDRIENAAQTLLTNGKEEHTHSRSNETTPSATPQPSVAMQEDTPLTKEQAEDISLAHTGFAREQVSGLRSKYEIDDGIPQYDVEFRREGWEYEFEIHAGTGKILSYDKDRERY